MRITRTKSLAAVALAAAGACTTPPRTTPQPATSPAGSTSSISAAEAARLEAIVKARTDSAKMRFTEGDVNFMSGMIGHHAQAIVMSRWAPTHGASSAVQVLAARIINAQQDEIALMQNWLRDRNLPVPEAKPGPMKMKMDGMEHEMLMPGMLTDAQMQQLDAARGAEFDRLFLTFMIQHHQGAVTMVKDWFGTYGSGQDEAVFKIASDVQVDQNTEIARMQQMLDQLAPNPRSNP